MRLINKQMLKYFRLNSNLNIDEHVIRKVLIGFYNLKIKKGNV